MKIAVADYLIDQAGIDWSQALAEWSWLLPSEFTLWLVSRYCDLFIVTEDCSVQMLDVGVGTLQKVAENRDDFFDKIDVANNANEWLMIPLVEQMIAEGNELQSGQCYGFKTPPVLGGDYTTENSVPISILDYLPCYGSIHGQLRDVPDGSQVVLRVINKETQSNDQPN